ncbi:lipase 1-like [Zerene cesonia]|uniref:lipase 1-like n=1 Tax=Zerene cesonia TaxID=33412 RepID=UPI0018E5265B|nr:lipase 1-like [Zerene cesonia]
MKTVLIIIYYCIKFCAATHQARNVSGNLKNFTEITESYGLKTESYEVVTEDAYILKLFHIPGSVGPPILLVHGYVDSSDTWVIRGEDSLGITLARKSHDLWFANCRGNHYSRNHLRLDPDRNVSFWDFSFHEIGFYDMPALIDAVLNRTQWQKLNLIGHSQGNTVFYILGSTKPEYNDKINLAVALSPVCFFHKSSSPMSIFLKNYPLTQTLLKSLNIHEFFGYNSKSVRILRKVCSMPDIGYKLCIVLGIFFISGEDTDELEEDFENTMFYHYPAGASSKSFVHYEQVGTSRRFARFDYGRIGNLATYESPEPPLYDLSKVKMPIVLLAGKNDNLSSLDDVEVLRSKLTNVVEFVVVPHQKMNHVDFIWGRNARKYLFPYIFKALHRYRMKDNKF